MYCWPAPQGLLPAAHLIRWNAMSNCLQTPPEALSDKQLRITRVSPLCMYLLLSSQQWIEMSSQNRRHQQRRFDQTHTLSLVELMLQQ